MIRVVNAFRHGLDSQQLQNATSNPNIQRVLQKQASLGKRMSTTSAMSQHSDGGSQKGGAQIHSGGGQIHTGGAVTPGMVVAAIKDTKELPSLSHTETAV